MISSKYETTHHNSKHLHYSLNEMIPHSVLPKVFSKVHGYGLSIFFQWIIKPIKRDYSFIHLS